MGTPDSAVPILNALRTVSEVVYVITRPDQPRGRARTPHPSAVKKVADSAGLVVVTPGDRDELEQAVSARQVDVAVVAAFGMIVPKSALDTPRAGMVNVHFSLLPAWRGAAPVERCILGGDQVTGVTLMQMDEGLDTGPILAHWTTAIGDDETAGALTERLAGAGAELLVSALAQIVRGDRPSTPQENAGASYASMLTTPEARIDWTLAGSDIVRRVRAFNPRPGAHTFRAGTRFKIHRARLVSNVLDPGQMAMVDGELVVGVGNGAIAVSEIQPAGGRRMAGGEWARGVRGDLGRFE